MPLPCPALHWVVAERLGGFCHVLVVTYKEALFRKWSARRIAVRDHKEA